jgi:hypothetical protein
METLDPLFDLVPAEAICIGIALGSFEIEGWFVQHRGGNNHHRSRDWLALSPRSRSDYQG